MKFVSVRELRNRPGEVWKKLREDDLVLTANGKPRGILTGVGEDDLEAALDGMRRGRALAAASRIRRRAAASGLDRLPTEKIEEEIRAARRDRKRHPEG